MKRHSRLNVLLIIAFAIGLSALCGLAKGKAGDNEESLRGRIIVVGIPGASAISPVGTFLPGGPIHDNPAFAAVLRRTRRNADRRSEALHRM